MLIEREHELAELTARLAEAETGSGRLVFLGGEAGIGKTTLAAALADAAGRRLAVRRGACDGVTATGALQPLIDAVPELADVIENTAVLDRVQLFRRIRSLLAAEPTLLLLEDVHWADEATLDLLRFLGRRLTGVPVLLVATYRDDEAVAGSPLAFVLGDLATAPGVSRTRLAPLSLGGVRRLLTAAGSALSAEALHRSTGGNPFFVTEVLFAGHEELPSSVRDAVLARTAQLSTQAREVLAAAAVLGQRAGLALLTSVAGVPVAAVDECVRRGVLVAADGDDGEGWAFRHELARRAVESTLPPGDRARLHARALAALRAEGVRDASRLAHHAAASGDAAAVLEFAPSAAARSARLGAHRTACAQYRTALRFAGPDHPDRVRLLEALSYECYLTDQLEQALTVRRAAMRLSEAAGDTVAAGTDLRWLSRLSWMLGRNGDANLFAARAVTALEQVDDGHELAMAYSNLAQLRMLEGNADGAVTWGERALAIARRIGDRETEIHALNNVGTALATQRPSADGQRLLERSLSLALLDDAHEHAARAYTNLGSVAVVVRRFADADRQLRAGIAYCEDRDLDSWANYMGGWLARSLAEQGRSAEAQEQARAVLARPGLLPVARMTAAPVLGIVAARRGEPDGGSLDEALALAVPTGEEQRVVPVAVARAEAAWLAGRMDDVVAEVDRAWPLAAAFPNPWTAGELAWWLSVAGVRREPAVVPARPFARMLDGDWPGAAREWEALGAPLWSAYALASSPDLADGRRAVEIADRLGLPAVREALLRARHALGIPVPRGPRGNGTDHPARLTDRELEVLGLLARGLTNADIAAQLFLSEKTVGHHVSAVLRKLGESSRAGAVAAAMRREIIAPV